MTARLAVVDDELVFTDFIETLLRSRGYSVDTFNHGTMLIDRLKAGYQPNLVLLDVMMPDIDGLETLRTIKQANQNIQVIMLSGAQAPATIVDALKLGAADYVVKPGDADGVGEAALEAAIRNALERQTLRKEVERIGLQLSEDPEGTQPCWNSSGAMQDVLQMVDRVADSDVSVLLTGESGVGKEVIARELHRRSDRRAQPFVKVNCAALPADLLESEMFGHERGAFTGAGTTRVGKFEFADRGTILLDEIGETPPALQAKLLHVIQDRQLTRLGSNRPIDVDARILAATNQDLEAMIRAGTFREDLYYRLQVIEIRIPPLRERQEEILPLVEFFLAKFAHLYKRPRLRLTPQLRSALVDYPWPGNIRELENMIKRFVVLQDESLILNELARLAAADLPKTNVTRHSRPVSISAPAAPSRPMNGGGAAPPPAIEGDLHALAKAAALRAERQAIDDALTKFHWNRRKAAAYLKVSYKTLLNKMKECGISEAASNDDGDA
jgi:two-component system, NtrC family, response regulator AtoC